MANVEFIQDREPRVGRNAGVLKRMEAAAGEMSALRDRLIKLQVRIDGAPEAAETPQATPGVGLRGNLDRFESDLRSAQRTLGQLEELF